MRSILVVFAALTATASVIGAGGAATAAAPTREPVHDSQAGSIDCGTFHDDFVDFYDGTVTTWYDEAGNPSRQVFHLTHLSNDVNSVTGKTIHEHGTFTETLDYVNGTDSVAGRLEIATVPGSGVVIQDAGRLVLDANGDAVLDSLNHRQSIPDTDERYCLALG